MAFELYTGTETVSTTEWSMTTDTAGPDADTTPGTYQTFIDVSALAAGDVYQVAVYEKARSADTQRLLQAWTLTGAQASPLWSTQGTFTLMNGWDFTLKKLAGTDRVITWSIRDTVKGVAVVVTTNNDKTGYGLSSAAVQAIWDALTSALTTAGSIGKKLADWVIGTTQTGDSFARLGAPQGASMSADIAAVKVDSAAILLDTGPLTYTVAGQVNVNVKSINDISITGTGVETTNEWRPA